jgi:eukaryotic-like serine/threonine-protein kinase
MPMQSDDTDQFRNTDVAVTASGSYARLRDLFVAASEFSGEARAAWLNAHVPDPEERTALDELLAADEIDGILETPADEHAARMADDEPLRPEGLIGTSIGAFRLTRLLGKGGMAIVFLGAREGADFEQRVAVKLLRRGLYSEVEQRLFRRERQLLAGLDHPNIARLIDGGVTVAGIPYLVIEYVDGEPITHHAGERGMDVRERLNLFLIVCRAVEAAHRALIVHRDIKPSNILVASDGTVKLLDFGIAKLLEEDTESATVGVFTPEYAAPEQLAGAQVTTATDVYALGVLLHELLVGVRPHGNATRRPSSLVGAQASERANLPKPELLARALRGDLDNIVLKALDPEPGRRYASAGAFADDIERFLARRPVAAHPPSRLYRTRKFIQRHRGGVIVTVAFLLAILASLGLALWQAQVARNEAARANTVRDFVIGVFDTAGAHLPRDQRPTPEALVAQAQQRLAGNTNLDRATRVDMLSTLGEVDLSLSNFARAETTFAAALALTRESGDANNARQLSVLHADAMQRAGHNADALHDLTTQLDALRAKPSPVTLRALGVMAAAEMALGTPDAAIAHRREAAAAAAQIFGPDHVEAIAAALDVGNTLADAQRYPEAIAVLDPLLARWRSGHDPEDDRYVAALSSLATATDGVGDVSTTEKRLRELLALKRRIYPAPHDAIAKTLRELGQIVARTEKYTEAEALTNEALTMDRQVFGEDHREIAATYDDLGEIMVAQRRFVDADADYRAAIAVCERAQIKEEVCPRARNNLGMSLYRQQRLEDAKTEMTQALAERRALFGNDHPTVAYSLQTLANVAVFQKDFAEAVRLSAEALAILERDGHGASREAAMIRNGYAQALWLVDRSDDALREIDRTLADWQRVAPEGKARRVMMLVLKIQILQELKRPDDARNVANEAIAVGANPADLAPAPKDILRKVSGRNDVFPEAAAAKASK